MSYEETQMGLWSVVVRDSVFEPCDVPAFEEKLFFEGVKRRQHLEQFGVLRCGSR